MTKTCSWWCENLPVIQHVKSISGRQRHSLVHLSVCLFFSRQTVPIYLYSHQPNKTHQYTETCLVHIIYIRSTIKDKPLQTSSQRPDVNQTANTDLSRNNLFIDLNRLIGKEWWISSSHFINKNAHSPPVNSLVITLNNTQSILSSACLLYTSPSPRD